jgi:hypothetical protein
MSFGIRRNSEGAPSTGERRLLRGTVCSTARKFRRFSYEGLVFFTPINNNLVFVHWVSPSLYLKMTALTCLTWYGFALLPSRCRLILSSTPALRKR